MRLATNSKFAFDALLDAVKEIGVDFKANYANQSVETEILTSDELDEIFYLTEGDIYW